MKNISIFCGNITRCGGAESSSILPANEWAKQPGGKVVFYSLTESNSKTYFDLESHGRHFHIFHRDIPFHRILLPIIFRCFFFLRREKISLMIDDVILSLASFFAAILPGLEWMSWKHFHENLGYRLRSHARNLAKHFTPVIVVLTGNDRFQYLVPSLKAQGVQITNEVPSPMKNACNDTCREIPDAPFLLSIRRLDYQKGFERIPALATRILKCHPEWKWEIAGDGIFRKRVQLKTLAGSLNLSGKIHFQGECRNLALWNRYADARSFTSHDKGWGNVIMRTMLQGLPVIALGGRYGAVEMITSYRNGIPVPLDNGRLDYIRKTAAYLDRLPESRARYSVETIHAEYFYSGKSLSLQRSNCRSKKKGTIRISKLRRTFQTRGILRSLYSKRVLQYSTAVFRNLGIPCTYFITGFSGGEKLTGMLPQTLRAITCKT